MPARRWTIAVGCLATLVVAILAPGLAPAAGASRHRPYFSQVQSRVAEEVGQATIAVERGADRITAVNYAATPGTATAQSDFVPTSGTLSFEGQDHSKTFPLAIVDDGVAEGDETVVLTLSITTGRLDAVTNEPMVVEVSKATLTISANDGDSAMVTTTSSPGGAESPPTSAQPVEPLGAGPTTPSTDAGTRASTDGNGPGWLTLVAIGLVLVLAAAVAGGRRWRRNHEA